MTVGNIQDSFSLSESKDLENRVVPDKLSKIKDAAFKAFLLLSSGTAFGLSLAKTPRLRLICLLELPAVSYIALKVGQAFVKALKKNPPSQKPAPSPVSSAQKMRTYQMVQISDCGDLFEIEDGSVWKVNPTDKDKVVTWNSSDRFFITQNHSISSGFSYKIINTNTLLAAEIDLEESPIENGPHTLSVSKLDFEKREVVLKDSSRWKISSYDDHLFQDWQFNDLVIIGQNTAADSHESEALLINVDTGHKVRASRR